MEEEPDEWRREQKELLTLANWLLGQIDKSDPAILEIGAGRGLLTATFFELGNDILGVEPSNKLADQARSVFDLGSRLVCDTAGNFFSKSKKKYDILVMWHVLEHLDKPLDVLRSAARSLSDGGVMAIQTPLPLERFVYPGHLFFPDFSTYHYLATFLNLRVKFIDFDPENSFITCLLENADKNSVGDNFDVEENHMSKILNRFEGAYSAAKNLAGERLSTISSLEEKLEFAESLSIDRLDIIEKLGGEISERDNRLSAAESLALDRLDVIEKLGAEISDRDNRLIAAESLALNRYETIKKMSAEISVRDERIAAAESLALQRLAVIEEMSEEIRIRDEEIAKLKLEENL